MNVATFLTKSAVRFPDRPALQYGSEITTYRQFTDRSLAIGGELLARGLRKGDRVAFVMSNRPEILEVIFGCFAAGLVVVPMNARLHPMEMAYLVENSGARVLIHTSEFETPLDEHWVSFGSVEQRFGGDCSAAVTSYDELTDSQNGLKDPVDIDESDVCWLFYTSGTTGKPKGATWTHRVVRVCVMNYLADCYNIQHDDVMLHVAPLSHGSGILALPAVARGANNAISDSASFSPDSTFRDVERLGVTHIAFMAPTQIVKCLEEFEPGKYDIGTWKAVCYGGAPIYVEHLKKAVQVFGPVFVQIFGQGECPMTATVLPREEHLEMVKNDDPRLASCGFTRTDVEVKIFDENDEECPPGVSGEIVIRGDIVMAGYWNNPEATAEALRGGWLHTGDVGQFDEGGYLFLLDRTKDMIISGGNNVYPREVEEVLITHPSVAGVCVIGIPDDYWGEAVHAVVVPEAGTAPTAKELIDFCAGFMAGYKKPKNIDFVDELPTSAYGKILRREVRAKYWATDRAIAGG
ncbi:long-chain fatty acid--CoA ligase [Sporichthya sp.]|uniref:acyl-CoA synthetase n=1 Tax=Sporichthya sp. TaxID=65475 RepID=UPI00185C086D|nr:long-chain fatty acid--CoA ligase [Sporichthya sp.]MBA3742662.1 long-chain fatty acid--CoA ligase [Sporichthya sp.]